LQVSLSRLIVGRSAKGFKPNNVPYAWRHQPEMTVEEIIQEILAKRPDTTRDKVLEALEAERRKTGGLIADTTLLRLIAARLNVEVASKEAAIRKLSTGILVPQLNDVTISGRVIAAYPTRTFEGAKSGKYASLIIADRDGTLRVMLWNDKVNFLESGGLRAGLVARFSHGYTREDRNGKTELHLSEKSKIEIDPPDLTPEEFPTVDDVTTKIKKLDASQLNVHLSGKVKEVSPVSAFTRQDQTSGKVGRFVLSDETGDVAVVVWNEKAEDLEKILKPDAKVRLVNARVKVTSAGGFEVHVDAGTYSEVSTD